MDGKATITYQNIIVTLPFFVIHIFSPENKIINKNIMTTYEQIVIEKARSIITNLNSFVSQIPIISINCKNLQSEARETIASLEALIEHIILENKDSHIIPNQQEIECYKINRIRGVNEYRARTKYPLRLAKVLLESYIQLK